MVRLLLFASVVPVGLCHGCYVRHYSFMGFCCLFCIKTGHCNASWSFFFCIIFYEDFSFPVIKVVTIRIQGLVVYSCCISGCSGTVTLGVFGCHPLLGEFVFRFFSFPGTFLPCYTELPVKYWSIPAYALSLRDSRAAVSASVRRRTPQLLWALMKGDLLCKGTKRSFHKDFINIVDFCLAKL